MKLFGPIYEKMLRWSAARSAPYILALVSFAESSFFPVPPDVMLAPMTLAKPDRWYKYALITTVASVLGGILGYLIGMFAVDLMAGFLASHADKVTLLESWFSQYGIWIILVAGFTPIPYKLFTVSAGISAMSFVPFVLLSLIARGARFFLIAGLVKWLGPVVEPKIRQYIDWFGWLVVALIIALVAYKTMAH